MFPCKDAPFKGGSFFGNHAIISEVLMNHKRIAVLMLSIALFTTGCSGLTLGQSTDPGSDSTSTAQSGRSSAQGTIPPVTEPATQPATQPVVQPQTKPPTEEELLVEAWKDRIYPGVKISGFLVGGMTFDEARDKMENGRKLALDRVISYRTDGAEGSVSQTDLGVWFDYESALEEAMNAWKDLSVEEQAALIRDESGELSLTAAMTYDNAKLTALAEAFSQEVQREVKASSYGRSLDKEAFKETIAQAIRYSLKNAGALDAPMDIVALEISEEDQKTISKSYSWFDEGAKSRSFNVKRATESLNGTVIQPGEVFSFNDTVGSASKNNGYKAATVYSGNEMAEGYGGGVCQVSSTLYNAIIHAGLPLVERHTHGYTVNYLPKGMDATIYYPSLDLKFRNTFGYPITIKASADDGDLSFRFVSHKDVMEGVTYEFSRKLIFEDKEEWESIPSKDLEPGKTRIIYYPHPATAVDVFRTTLKDGEKVETKHFDEVSYRTLKGRKKVGVEEEKKTDTSETP